jgi:hypothetical protein
MKRWLCRGVLAAAIALPALSGTQIPALAQFAQEQRGQEHQGIKGVWDVRITIIQCDTGKTILTGRAMIMYIDGGRLTSVGDNFLHSASLGMWRHLRGRNYTAVDRFFVFNADGSFAGTQETARDIELSSTADEYTAAATFEFFDPADQLIRTGCATSTATRLE